MKKARSFWNRQRGFAVFYLLLGLFLLWYSQTVDGAATSGLRFSTLGLLEAPTRLTLLACGIVSLITAGAGLALSPHPRVQSISLGINAFEIILAVLVWASLGRSIDVVGMSAQSLRLATPIALGMLAGVMCERSGVVNIAIEGMMLMSACIGFTVALYTQNIWIGVLGGLLAGAVMAALHALLSIQFMIDQIISGTVINILAVGITGFIRRAYLLKNPFGAPSVLPILKVPVLSDIPIIGPIFFNNQPMVYTMLILVVVVHIVLFYTVWGLRTRAVGEHPRAADTLGINVFKIRYINVILSGLIAGLGGVWFSLETVGSFQDIMTGGKGFIALAAMIFGKWTPFGGFGGALLFGFADALQIKLQISGVSVPYQFLGMLPYIVTMVVLAGLIGRAIAPAADGVPYEKRQ
jgi:ABC-type uncharacterized transport system permease subunit